MKYTSLLHACDLKDCGLGKRMQFSRFHRWDSCLFEGNEGEEWTLTNQAVGALGVRFTATPPATFQGHGLEISRLAFTITLYSRNTQQAHSYRIPRPCPGKQVFPCEWDGSGTAQRCKGADPRGFTADLGSGLVETGQKIVSAGRVVPQHKHCIRTGVPGCTICPLGICCECDGIFYRLMGSFAFDRIQSHFAFQMAGGKSVRLEIRKLLIQGVRNMMT
ncbi:hypothetical protein BJ138DRAFT_764785 [Hygrophoropsis aurantiaca]|uniref:Uncharacterized protein n=1 Tax=Hygrophoropsis aurantiaca TaxID=72124 RepID=A0ACB8AUF0_9AGAM|nr:hypothetical protein BJ138DRAFT_764785 [Hygrophoropsis aurantiaca]